MGLDHNDDPFDPARNLLTDRTDTNAGQWHDGVRLPSVVPVYNEDAVLAECQKRLSQVLQSLALPYEIIYVNDGSVDTTLAVARNLADADEHVAIVDLSRNFGKEIAVTASLDHCRGDAAAIIDADLQDPPELIPEMIRHWQAGYDVVYGERIARQGDTLLKKATAHVFYRLLQRIAHIGMPEDSGDFRLLSRRAVDAMKRLRDQHRFMKGLFAWIGYPQIAVPYQRDLLFAGKTKWSYWRLWNLAIEGITSFTIAPLKLASYLGLATALLAFSYGAYFVIRTLLYGNPVPGYPSLLVIMVFLGGIELLSLGIIGEYLGRTFDEAKQRPLYFTKAHRTANIRFDACIGRERRQIVCPACGRSESPEQQSAGGHGARIQPMQPPAPGAE